MLQHALLVELGSRDDCFDNAVAESFFATLKKELVKRPSAILATVPCAAAKGSRIAV
jgi:hypothetical protein